MMLNPGVRNVIRSLSVLALLVGLAACGGTRLSDMWRDPQYSGEPFRQVAVFVVGADPAVQRLVEDEVVRRLPMNTRGIGGYGLIPDAERGDVEKAVSRLRAGGYDGAMIARLVGVDGPTPWASGSLKQVPVSYRTLANYYVNASEETARSSVLGAPTVVRVQMNVYAVASQALVWSAASRTFNPEETRDVAGDVAKVAVEELQKAGLLSAE
jgi:hypothetical protein